MEKKRTPLLRESYQKEHRRRRKWRGLVAVLGCVVAAGTIGALTLPAITMSKVTCGYEEHTHNDKCYVDGMVLSCNAETQGLADHAGDDHYANFVLHKHDEKCRDLTGNLVCELPEIEEHTHNDNCYVPGEDKVIDPGHTHTDACYEMVKSETPTCGMHVHTAECHGLVDEVICQLPLTEGHTHSAEAGCFDAEGNTICEQEEGQGHPAHTAECCTQVDRIVCGLEETEGHAHDDKCYGMVRGTQICPEEERERVTEPGEPVLHCDKPEIAAHTHEKQVCYHGNGEHEQHWSCDKLEVKSHQHSDACFQPGKILTCTIPEHTHGETCREEVELTEEQQQQLDAVTAAIDGLPALEELQAQLAAAEDRDAFLAEAGELLRPAREAYDSLEDFLKEGVGNYETLTALEGFLAVENAKLSDEEQKAVDDVISIIDGLPELQAEKDEYERLLAEEDQDTLAAFTDKIYRAVMVGYDGYNNLSQKQQDAVTNYPKLEGYLAWLKEIGLFDDSRHPAKHYKDGTYTELCDDPISIVLTGELPAGAEVRAFQVKDFSMGEDGTVLAAYDISIFLEDGTVYQPEQPVTVKFSGLDIRPGMELDVFHDLEDEWGGMERMDYTVDGNSVSFQASRFSMYAIVDAYKLNRIAEPAINPGIIDDAWINYWSNKVQTDTAEANAAPMLAEVDTTKPSSQQITAEGGSNSDGTVKVSKTIQGTDVENVFDITLKVDTTTNITEVMKDPDMAVVIVMDISNTMNDAFGGSTRYKAAMEAAEAFLDKFAAANNGYSRIGYVAFNTDAHQIFGLSECSTTAQATTLKNTMRTGTGKIISASGYKDAHTRFTNVEAGLKLGQDMLKNVKNSNKYIIFLSDGFPTTYVKSGYAGYDPYTSSGTPGTDGVCYDYLDKVHCDYGTSYSDKAAIRAREMATAIKNSGTKIFSIGIDVGGQTIDQYERDTYFSIIDRTSNSYEIGSSSDANAFKNWLGNSIGSGSGYYYDSTNTEGLKAAYDAIFEQIKSTTEQANNLKWIASDPMPVGGTLGNEVTMEFIGFFNQNGALQVYPPQTSLTGSGTAGAENTISFDTKNSAIAWDIKNSGYTTTGSGSSTTYHYKAVYRVRLKNELAGFAENQSHQTNGTTTLTYQEVKVVDGKETLSGDKTIEFPIPAVKGYLGELTFRKVDEAGGALQGAEFELKHDAEKCKVCRGDGKSTVEAVEKKTYTATSGADGIVTFTGIPSGHTYTLVETKIPAGYLGNGCTYEVKVEYDVVTVTETDKGDKKHTWDLTKPDNPPEVVNNAGVKLPATGGAGTSLYIFSGLGLMAAAALVYNNKRKLWKGEK